MSHQHSSNISCHIIMYDKKNLSYSYDIYFKLCFHRCILFDEIIKLDHTCIYFKKINKLNLLYKYRMSIYVCLMTQKKL
jgi:hypothetical protein